MPKDPSAIAEKQIRRLSSAIPDVEEGVRSVTESPTEKAAANLDKAMSNYQAAIQSGKMARNLKAVTVDDWKQKTLAKVSRIPQGIEAARSTLEKFHAQRNAAQEAINAKLKSLPKRTLEDSIRRMETQVRGMAGFSFDKSK